MKSNGYGRRKTTRRENAAKQNQEASSSKNIFFRFSSHTSFRFKWQINTGATIDFPCDYVSIFFLTFETDANRKKFFFRIFLSVCKYVNTSMEKLIVLKK
jgi:hypothetical protein